MEWNNRTNAEQAGRRTMKQYIIDILKFDKKIEKYVEDFATFSVREKEETVEEIHDIVVACSHPYQSERDAVPERLHIWFENYCEGNEDPDLWMAFLHAERTLRQAGEP